MIQFADDCGPTAPDQTAEAVADPFFTASPSDFYSAPKPPTFNDRGSFQGFLPGAAVSELEASTMSGYGLEYTAQPTPVAPHPLTFVFLLAIGWAAFGR